MNCFSIVSILSMTFLGVATPVWAKGDMVLVEIMGGDLPSTIRVVVSKIEEFNIWAGPGVNDASSMEVTSAS